MDRRDAFREVRAGLAVALIGVGGLALAGSAWDGLSLVDANLQDDRSAQERDAADVYDCLEATLRAEVPRGTRVHIDKSTVGGSDYRRLTEIATPWTDLEEDGGQATITIHLETAPVGAGCGGTMLVTDRSPAIAKDPDAGG